jgi:seryl-tRNA synthetase
VQHSNTTPFLFVAVIFYHLTKAPNFKAFYTSISDDSHISPSACLSLLQTAADEQLSPERESMLLNIPY